MLWVLIQDIFEGWTGDVTSVKPTTTVDVDSPKRVTAVWRRDYTGIIALIVMILSAVIIYRFREY